MATTFDSVDPGVSIGRVFSRGFGVLVSNPLTMFGVAFLFQALPSLLTSYLRLSLQQDLLNRDGAIGVGAISIASGLIGLVLAMLVQGALVRATVAYSEGRKASFGESVAAGLAVALPLVGVTFLMVLALMVGMLLLVVPAVILYVMWAVATPALVEERTGVFGAFGRSRELTKGARWKVFGVELIIVITLWLIGIVAGVAMMSRGPAAMQTIAANGFPIWWLVGNAMLSTILGALWCAIQTSLYVELRIWKDGPSSSGLEEIFA